MSGDIGFDAVVKDFVSSKYLSTLFAVLRQTNLVLPLVAVSPSTLHPDPMLGNSIGLVVGVGVGVGVTLGVGVGVALGVGVGVTFFTATPLFQINFFPDLTQVYLIPDDVLVWPRVLQAVPGLTAASANG